MCDPNKAASYRLTTESVEEKKTDIEVMFIYAVCNFLSASPLE